MKRKWMNKHNTWMKHRWMKRQNTWITKQMDEKAQHLYEKAAQNLDEKKMDDRTEHKN